VSIFPGFPSPSVQCFPGSAACPRHVASRLNTLEGTAAAHSKALSEPFSLKGLGDELRFMFIVRVLGRVLEGAHPDEMAPAVPICI
jgi:hypothetical protein